MQSIPNHKNNKKISLLLKSPHTWGLFLLMAALLIIFFSNILCQKNLNTMINQDLSGLYHDKEFAQFFRNTKHIRIIRSEDDPISRDINEIKIPLNEHGTLLVELLFFRSDDLDPLLILQISFFNLTDQNKIEEFSRSYELK